MLSEEKMFSNVIQNWLKQNNPLFSSLFNYKTNANKIILGKLNLVSTVKL